MDDEDIKARFELAKEVVAEAAALALAYSRDLASLTVQQKGPQDVVSEADKAVEDLIASRIAARFPEDGFVGEETGSHPGGQGVWVVDPIDGTQNYLLGLPTWCVSIAFVADGDLAFGFITSPVTDDRFSALRGHGATWNDRPVHASSATSLTEGVTCIGYSSKAVPAAVALMIERLTSAGGALRSLGSGALMLVYVATGQCLGYLETYINGWDCLAAICIVNEAGGRTSDFLTPYGPAGHGPIIAAAPGVFDQLAALMPPDAP